MSHKGFYEVDSSWAFTRDLSSWDVITVEETTVNSDVSLFLIETEEGHLIGFGSSEELSVPEEVMDVTNFSSKVGAAEEYISLLDKRSCVYCSEGMPLFGHPRFVSLLACPDCHDSVKTQFEQMLQEHSVRIMSGGI